MSIASVNVNNKFRACLYKGVSSCSRLINSDRDKPNI